MNARSALLQTASICGVAACVALVAQAQPTVATASLPPATIGVPYNAKVSATGGTPPYTWQASTIPQGLTLNSGTPSATLEGTPSGQSSYEAILDPVPLGVQVTDANNNTTHATLLLSVAYPIAITTTVLPAAPAGKPYSTCLDAKGGTLATQAFWAIIGGTLPTGLTFGTTQSCPGPGPAPMAAISGTPTQTGAFPLTFRVSDQQGRMAQMSLTLTIGGSGPNAVLNVAPNAVSTSYTVGANAPPVQAVLVTSTSSISYNSSVSYVSGAAGNANWVTLTNASGITPATLEIGLNPAGLAAGTYQANISVSSDASNSAVTLPVSIDVTQGVTLTATPPGLTFTYIVGSSTNPLPQTVKLAVSSGQLQGVTYSVNSGSNWLTVIPPGETPVTSLTVVVNPSGLSPGTYTGSIQISAPNTSNSPITVNVTLNVMSAGPNVTSLLNGASLEVGPAAPGLILTLKGAGLGPDTGVAAAPDSQGDYATTLGGYQVLFNGTPGPMLYAQSSQINAIIPFEASMSGATVQIGYGGQTYGSYALNMQPVAPALFTSSGSGTGQGAILNQDGTVNSDSNPAKAGTIVSLFGTGGGPFQISMGDGTTAGKTNLMLPVTAQVGGASAQVIYAGSAPTLVAGAMQINVMIPAGTRAGDIPVVVTINGVATQSPVTIAVR